MHCGGPWGSHCGYCAGCGAPIIVEEELGPRPPAMRGRMRGWGRRGEKRFSQQDEVAALREQIEALREELSAITQRLGQLET